MGLFLKSEYESTIIPIKASKKYPHKDIENIERKQKTKTIIRSYSQLIGILKRENRESKGEKINK